MILQRVSVAAACLVASALVLAGCGNGAQPAGSTGSGGTGGTGSTGSTQGMCALPPAGASGPVVEPLMGGKGVNLVTIATLPLPDGWVQEELALAGTATSYASEGDLPADGMFKLTEKATADYRTRIVVRRPGSAKSFNGTVVVEWLNVSGGIDASPDHTFMQDELVRGGYAWVGVSAQYVGIEGGKSPLSPSGEPSPALRDIDSERYGKLHHPGDAFAYDMFTQVARALRAGACVLGDLVPQKVLAAGESQSAFMLTTYVNGVQPLAKQYDGFFIHSRAGGAAPLGEPDAPVAFLSAISGTPTQIRSDLDVPVLVLETETDVLNLLKYFPARQPDTDHFRLWEVAGTAHADSYLLGAAVDMFKCDAPVNSGPAHFVVKSALRHLDAWSRGNPPPPAGGPFQIDTKAMPVAYIRNTDGILLGGIRTPEVDAPVDVLSGDPYGGSVLCLLFGSTTPLPDKRLAELYSSKDAYLSAYTKAADAAIQAGFVLAEDRDALLADAKPSRIAP